MADVAELQDAISRDLAWRKLEISRIRGDAHNAAHSEGHLFRAGQVMLFAHWEGFLKKSASLYLKHALEQRVRIEQATEFLISAAIYPEVMRAASAKYPGSDEHQRLAHRFTELLSAGVTGQGWTVDTEGNPGSEVLNRILRSIGVDLQLGMDDAAWATTKVFINEIVRDRNIVAHGEGLPITKNDLLSRADRLLSLLDTLALVLMTSAESRKYLIEAA